MPTKFSVIAIGVLAGILVVVAIMMLPVRLLQAPTDYVRSAMLAYEPVSKVNIEEFLKDRQSAMAWRQTPDSLSDMARVSFARAVHIGPTNPKAKDEIAQSITWQKVALASAPVDPYGWAQLAYLYLQSEGVGPRAAGALKLSMETGPYEPHLMPGRLRMMFQMADRLDPDMQKQLPFVIRAAWKSNPQEVANAARDNHSMTTVEEALANEPEELAGFKDLTSKKK